MRRAIRCTLALGELSLFFVIIPRLLSKNIVVYEIIKRRSVSHINLIGCLHVEMSLYPYSFLPHSTLDQAISGETVVFAGLSIVLNHDVMQHMSMNIRESEAPALEFEGELFVVDAHQMH